MRVILANCAGQGIRKLDRKVPILPLQSMTEETRLTRVLKLTHKRQWRGWKPCYTSKAVCRSLLVVLRPRKIVKHDHSSADDQQREEKQQSQEKCQR